MKLAKSAWKEKAGLVISRLKAVCLQWSSVLAISFFRNKVHRTLGRVGKLVKDKNVICSILVTKT